MTDLSAIIADFLLETDSNDSNRCVSKRVTTQTPNSEGGNSSSPGNLQIFNNQSMLRQLHIAAEISSLSKEQIWSFLDPSDVKDLQQGLISQQELNACAQSWARYPECVPVCNTLSIPTMTEQRKVKCRECRYFLPDGIGDGTGIGKCKIKAPASEKGLMWLNSERYCNN